MTRIDKTSELLPGVALKTIQGARFNEPEQTEHTESTCSDHHHRILAIQDAMAVLSGKWKILVLGSLSFKGKQRFTELLRSVGRIRAKNAIEGIARARSKPVDYPHGKANEATDRGI